MTRVENDGIMSEGNPARRPLSGMGGQIGMIITDLVVPVAGFYILRGFGIDAVLALILAGLPTVVAIGIRSIKQRKVGALGIFVLAILAGSVLLSFVTGSPRFLLAREGWFTGAIGVGFLVSLRFRRPVAFTFARTMIESTPMAARLFPHLWDDLWESDPQFRRTWRVVTALWGVGMIADAIVRVIFAYALPVDTVPLVTGILWAVTFVVLQVAQHHYFIRVGLWQRVAEYETQERKDSE
ncbi:VC0807 family protein [Paramicrobacterium fandaimingii]|uniref:VC0807 family protein n=1 Tax=Paramicrobacterium fandaimingii TaxID=2708079 RepID=UPI001C3FD9AD|nr:VC0807 family protein [Microbacterium fandaimingii]